MTYRGMSVAVAAVILIANCTCVSANPVTQIDNEVLQQYSLKELDRGAPSLELTSRVLYREALELLERGNWEGSREKLLLSASLAGDYPDPLFTLARIELMHAETDFVFHLFDGMVRLAGGFHSQALLAANAAILIVISLIGALLITLVVLLVKYWTFFDHWLRERYSKKISFPPQQWIGAILLVSLLITRAGLAIYIAVLMIVLWTFLSKKEKGVVLTLTILLSAGSFMSHYSNVLTPAVDPSSITRRLSLINERGVDDRLIEKITAIEDPQFKAERDYAVGTLLYRLGMHEDAKRYLLDAVSERPEFAPAYLNLGNVYFLQNDFDKALAGYQNVVAIDPENALAHYNIAQTYIQKMLFAESSQSLRAATELGIENYKASHPLLRYRTDPIYDQGFNTAMLWNISLREGNGRKGSLIGEILRPYLLFPFDRLFILLIASIIAAIIMSAKIPRTWDVFRCDNCRQAACPECANDETGIILCKDCYEVIQNLTSAKVMEALLRHRRQKISAKQGMAKKWQLSIFPGVPFIYHGKTFSGVILTFISISFVMILLWRGFYFKDPRVLISTPLLWKLIVPAALLLLEILVSLGFKAPQEQKNYCILPPEYHVEPEKPVVQESKPPQSSESDIPVEMGLFLDI